MKLYIFALAGILIILGVLKLLNTLFMQELKAQKTQFFAAQEQSNRNSTLFTDTVSYSKYKCIARRTSVRNSPHRKVGNYLDFLLANICEQSSAIENNLAYIDCGENYE